MEQNIAYKQMSGEASDYDVNDGILQQAVNVELRGGSYHVAMVPRETVESYENMKPVYVHYTSDGESHTLLLSVEDNGLYFKSDDGVFKKICDLENEPESIDSIGNTLIVLDGETNRFALYKQGSYKYIGTGIPDVSVSYRAAQVPFGLPIYNSGEYDKSNSSGISSYWYKAANEGDESNWDVAKELRNMYYILYNGADTKFTFVPLSYTYENIPSAIESYKLSAQFEAMKEFFFGAFNSVKSIKIDKKGLFMYPVLIRHAIRLYDGSYVNVSTPEITIQREDVVKLIYGQDDKQVATYVGFEFLVYDLLVKISSKIDIDNFSDLIQSVDFFISPPLYTIDTDDFEISYEAQYNTYANFTGSLKKRNIYKQAADVSTFYKIASFPLSKLRGRAYWKSIFDGKEDDERDLSNYIENETLAETLHSNCRYAVNSNLVYNKRLITAQNKRFLKDYSDMGIEQTQVGLYRFNGKSQYEEFRNSYLEVLNNDGVIANDDLVTYFMSPSSVYDQDAKDLFPVGEYPDVHQYETFLYMKVDDGYKAYELSLPTDGREIWPIYFPVQHNRQCILKIVRWDFDDNKGFYKAKQLTYEFESTPLVNTQVLVGENIFEHKDKDWKDYADDIQVSKNNFVYNTSVVASMAGNPFFANDSNSVDMGSNVITLATSAMEVSTGQFGQYPLFAFCTDGVFAISIGTDGSLQSRVPFSYDVLTNKASVSTIDRSLVFITSQGIIQIGDGRKLLLRCDENITYDFDNEHQEKIIKSETNEGEGQTGTMANLGFYLTNGAQSVYDYAHQRLIVFNPDYPYSYVYSFAEQAWSIITKQFSHALNGYDNCLLVSKKEDIDETGAKMANWSVWDYSSDLIENTKSGYLITRPLKLGQPDVLKTIKAIIQRGMFKSGNVRQALYGSRDGYNWVPVWSSKNEYLENTSGTGYKYFRLIIFLNDWTQKDSLSGCSIQFETRETNTLR